MPLHHSGRKGTCAARRLRQVSTGTSLEPNGVRVRCASGAPGRTRTGTPPFGIAADFKSAVSTGFTTGAANEWRRGSESNRRPRLCRPLHNHSATPPEERLRRLPDEGRKFGAGDESRTRDLNLGKVALYQLSYSRATAQNYSPTRVSLSNRYGPSRLDPSRLDPSRLDPTQLSPTSPAYAAKPDAGSKAWTTP